MDNVFDAFIIVFKCFKVIKNQWPFYGNQHFQKYFLKSYRFDHLDKLFVFLQLRKGIIKKK